MRIWVIVIMLLVAASTESYAFSMPGSGDGPSKKAQRLYRQALGALGSANYSKSIDLATQAIKESPKYAKAYSLRGKALKNMGDMDKSLNDLNKAIQLNPKLGEAYYIRAQMSEIMGEMASAESDYSKSCSAGYRNACK